MLYNKVRKIEKVIWLMGQFLLNGILWMAIVNNGDNLIHGKSTSWITDITQVLSNKSYSKYMQRYVLEAKKISIFEPNM